MSAPVAPPPARVPTHAGERVQHLAARRGARLARRRVRRARLLGALTTLLALAALAPLVSILGFLLARGARALTPALLGAAGATPSSFRNALAGSTLLLAIACLTGLPLGLGAGIWLAERRGTRRARLLRYLTDVLLGVPSIVFGVVAWQLLVRPVGHFSAWAGGVALGAMMVPLVARATADVLALVPPALGEAALALGYPRWRTMRDVVLRAALPGVVTAALLALARVSGETAPLLFTAFGNQFWSLDPDRPIAALPLQIYGGALGASEVARAQAYAGALVLVGGIALFGVAARAAARRAARGARGRGA